MDILSLRARLDRREISARELCKHYLDRITENKALNAFITVTEQDALKAADIADDMIRSGNISTLTGIPVSVKDNICTKDILTTCASKMLSEYVSPYDATVVSHLKSNGAVILGKTNMDEFSMGSDSKTSYFGGVVNPIDSSRSPGGSSGGSAVSVAANMCCASLGSDTGGSIRQPATFCGIVGLKPTYGRISRYGLIAFASSLDQIGIATKTPYDAGVVLNSIAGWDKLDQTSAKIDTEDFTALCNTTLKGTKIGIIKELIQDISLKCQSALSDAIDFFRYNGAEIIEFSIPSLAHSAATYYIISSAEAASNLSRFDGIRYGRRAQCSGSYSDLITASRTEGFGDEVKKRIAMGNYALSRYSDNYYRRALTARDIIKSEFSSVLDSCDVIISPTTPNGAYRLDAHKDNHSKYPLDLYTAYGNLTGLPVISVPCGFDENNMPLSMSVTGKQFCESTIIAIADAFYRREVKK